MGKRIGAVVALSLAVLAAVAVSGAPSQSQPDVASRLRAFGVPAGYEAQAAWHMDKHGQLISVSYRDSSGQLHKLGGDNRLEPTPAPES